MYQKRNNIISIIALYTKDYKKKIYLREISKLANLPIKTTQNIVKFLEQNKILKSTLHGKNKYFYINLDNIETKFFLLYSEIYKTLMFLEKYPEFKIFIKELSSESLIIIFGGFAKLIADKTSDVDVLVVSDKEEQLPTHLLPSKLHQINISRIAFLKSLDEQETLIKEIKENHIILNNHSFYVDMAWRYNGRR